METEAPPARTHMEGFLNKKGGGTSGGGLLGKPRGRAERHPRVVLNAAGYCGRTPAPPLCPPPMLTPFSSPMPTATELLSPQLTDCRRPQELEQTVVRARGRRTDVLPVRGRTDHVPARGRGRERDAG